MRLLAVVIMLAWSSTLCANSFSFAGVFQESAVQLRYWNNASWDSFIKKHKANANQGYQLIDFEGQHVGKGKSGRFWGIWRKSSVASRIKSVSGWDKFLALCKEQKQAGYALDDVESMLNRNGTRIYIGLFSKGSKNQKVEKFRSMDELEQQTKSYLQSGKWSVADVDQFTTNDGKNQYLAIYNPKGRNATRLITAKSAGSFDSERKKLRRDGWMLFDYEEFRYNGKSYFMGAFRKIKKSHSLWRDLAWHSMKAHRSHMDRHRNMKLVDIEVQQKKGLNVAPDSYVGKFKETPDIWQHMPAVEDWREDGLNSIKRTDGKKVKMFDSNSFCGPTAVSNGLIYWSKNGYNKLNPYKSQVEMVKVLGNEKHMNSYEGTNLLDMNNGLRKYLKDHGYKLQHAYIRHIGKPSYFNDIKKQSDVTMQAHLGKMDLTKVKKSVIRERSNVILLWGYYEKDDKGRLVRNGGHFVTVVGYGQDKNGKLNKNMLVIHNPSTSDKKPTQEYIEIKQLVGVDNIKADTRIETRNSKDEVRWHGVCKDVQYIKTRTKDGKKQYLVFDGFIDYRI